MKTASIHPVSTTPVCLDPPRAVPSPESTSRTAGALLPPLASSAAGHASFAPNRRLLADRYVVGIRENELAALPDDAQLETRIGQTGGADDTLVWLDLSYSGGIERLRTCAGVRFVEQSYLYPPAAESIPASDVLSGRALDPLVEQQTHLDVMQSIEAWKIQRGSSDVVVAVTDEGVDIDHEDLREAIWTNPDEIPDNGIDDDDNGFVDDVHGWNFSGDNNRLKGDTHGTHIAGLIGAVEGNGIGVSGTAAGVRLMPIKWKGDREITSATVAASFIYAANNGAKIISTSEDADDWPGDPVIERALAYLETKGVLHFNSAGNRRRRDPRRLQLTGSIMVAATAANGGSRDRKSFYSNYGAGIDLAAPGGGIRRLLSTIDGNRYGRKSGTSMATPNAASVAALVWSQHPEWNREQVYAQVVGTADDISHLNPSYVDQLGAGRVNALRAVTETIGPPTLSARRTRRDVTVRLRGVFSTESANDQSSWRIERVTDGAVVSRGAPERVRIATNELHFPTEHLPPGRYRLVASAASLHDPFGQALDGGRDVVFDFTVGD